MLAHLMWRVCCTRKKGKRMDEVQVEKYCLWTNDREVLFDSLRILVEIFDS